MDITTEARDAYTTFEWECRRCNVRTWMPSCGGELVWDCTCDRLTKCDGHDIHIYKILAGRREHFATVASLERRQPGEPSRARTHCEACTNPDCADWAHMGEPGFKEDYERRRDLANAA